MSQAVPGPIKRRFYYSNCEDSDALIINYYYVKRPAKGNYAAYRGGTY
jgi:hypothetical protein